MSQTVIKVENLSKQYRLGTVGTGTLSHDLNRWWHKVRGKEDPYLKIGESNDRATKGESEYVWALRDINFEVKQGEVLGIIGKNGAGKSTLLKILSKVTGPTTGSIKAKGRIASLLEVGTGFHPELTGRENIYLNGTILGMTKREVDRKLDEIVDFAGVARYLDTPVKRYSSGMTVRLGFAVAAHLEPEILVVDEVLAVGDAEFQKKAIGKMQEVSREGGRTVLFVSHNMASVKAICSETLLLADGSILQLGDTQEIIVNYLRLDGEDILFNKWGSGEIGTNLIWLYSAELKPKQDLFDVTTGFSIVLKIANNIIGKTLDATIRVRDDLNNVMFTSGAYLSTNKDSQQGNFIVKYEVPGYLLNSGRYHVELIVGESQKYVLISHSNILCFNIEESMEGRGHNHNRPPGFMRPLINIDVEQD